MLSGEAVASIPLEEIGGVTDVKGLKQHLTQLHGFPPRFRQRVFFHGENLEEDVKLDSPMILDFVLVTFADVSDVQADELAVAALLGSVAEVGSFERARLHEQSFSASFKYVQTVSVLHGKPIVLEFVFCCWMSPSRGRGRFDVACWAQHSSFGAPVKETPAPGATV